MHSIEELGTNVPAFLAKLWKIVEDPETNDLICWSPLKIGEYLQHAIFQQKSNNSSEFDKRSSLTWGNSLHAALYSNLGGTSFVIRNQARFSRELLPLYYKHNNMASFVRQLNMYGFHKVVSIEGGGLKVDKDEMVFAHQCFLMGHPYLLEHIKRKIPTSKVEEGRNGTKPELMNKVLSDVKNMKGRQDNLDSQLSAMKRENEVLWREVAILRQKHLKQQQIVNKLIQFLVTMVQSSRNGGIGIKRHYPLMLNDAAHKPTKIPKVNNDLHDVHDENNDNDHQSPTGPVIHELDATDFLEDCNPLPEEPQNESFLASDLCSVVMNGEVHSPNSSHSTVSPGLPSSESPKNSPEVLLGLSDDCPLSPSILLTASPLDVNPAIVAPRINKTKGKCKTTEEPKRKRLKRTPAKSTSATKEPPAPEQGIDLLDVVLPTLVSEKPISIVPTKKQTADVSVDKDLLTSSSLAAATDAAISAISSVAAASKNDVVENSESAPASSSDTIDKSAFNEVLSATDPIIVKTDPSVDVVEDATADSNVLMVSTLTPTEIATAGSVSPSNMILTCASSDNAEGTINREELDSHVDAMQNELDSLKELLKGEGYSLDANTLLGVCAAIPGLEQDFVFKLFGEDPTLPFMPTAEESRIEQIQEQNDKGSSGTEVSGTNGGNEVMTYSSNLLDIVDMFGGSETGEWSTPASPETNSSMDISLSELNTPQMVVTSPRPAPKRRK